MGWGGRGEFNTLVSSCISRVYVTTSSALQLFGRVHSSVTQDGPACTSRGGKDVCGRLPVVLKTTSVLKALQKKNIISVNSNKSHPFPSYKVYTTYLCIIKACEKHKVINGLDFLPQHSQPPIAESSEENFLIYRTTKH